MKEKFCDRLLSNISINHRRYLPGTLLAGNILGLIFAFFYTFLTEEYDSLLRYVFISLFMANFISLTCYLFFCFAQSILKGKEQSYKTRLLRNSLVGIFGALFGTSISILLLKNLLIFVEFKVETPEIFYIFLINIWLTILALSILSIYDKLKTDIEKKVLENQELKRLQLESKFALLQSKINPHFLFNTMNTLLSLIYTSPEDAEKAILKLSNLYRRILELKENDLISIADELEIIEDYLFIEKIRLDGRLKFEYKIEEELLHVLIPPLLIEPLIENSVIHGISKKKCEGKIQLIIERSDTKKILNIAVLDPGCGINKNQYITGFGLYSVQERLKLIYADKFSFVIDDTYREGTKIEMELPYDNDLHDN